MHQTNPHDGRTTGSGFFDVFIHCFENIHPSMSFQKTFGCLEVQRDSPSSFFGLKNGWISVNLKTWISRRELAFPKLLFVDLGVKNVAGKEKTNSNSNGSWAFD